MPVWISDEIFASIQLSHRQREASATREAIARTALQLFADRGYVATTIQAISEAADIPAPTIYQRWAVSRRSWKRFADSGSPRRALRSCTRKP
jgi:hypothetical protein